MDPLAASLALALAPPAAPAPKLGAGMPLSGVYGTSAAAAAPGGSKLARGGKRPTRPRADSFVAGMPAADGPSVRRVLPPYTADKSVPFPDTLEVVFFTNTRPVRVRKTAISLSPTRNGRPSPTGRSSSLHTSTVGSASVVIVRCLQQSRRSGRSRFSGEARRGGARVGPRR